MNWRTLLAGSVFVALLIAAVMIARPERSHVEEVVEAPRKPLPPAIAAPIPTLTRADLIDVAARAADAEARGVAPSPEDGALGGRRFSLRLPFGCAGPSATDSSAPMRWTYDAAEETLRVWVTPEVWTNAEPVRAAAGDTDFEAAEGFWIEQPWIRSADCPVLRASGPASAAPVANEQAQVDQTPLSNGAEAASVEGATASTQAVARRQTLALVELFRTGSRRAARRNGRPYMIITKVARDQIDLANGFRLILDGRLAPLRQGSPIACLLSSKDERPLCLIGAEVDHVTITDATGDRILGEWGS